MNNCSYCKENEIIYDDMKFGKNRDEYCGIEVFIEENIYLYVISNADTYETGFNKAKIKINYCPTCGRKLIDEEVIEDD